MGINLNWLTPALERARHFRGRRPQVGKIQIQHWQQLHFRLAAAHPMQILRLPFLASELPKVPQTYVVGLGGGNAPLEQTWRCYLRRFAVDHWNRFAKAVTLDTSSLRHNRGQNVERPHAVAQLAVVVGS